jgi:transcriptional regulator with XRE-family HTH domain
VTTVADLYFARRLRQFRRAALFTQAELAAKAGVHHATIGRYESGLNEPSWAHVKALAKALGLSVDAFVDPAPEDEPRRRKGR